MPASTRRSAARLAAAVLLVVLVGGCAGQTEESTTAAQATTSTVAPTTTVPPLTAKELAWLRAIPKVSRKIEKSVELIRNLTTSGLLKLANSLHSCTRELARGGSPSDRLEPVYVIVKKACREYDKGAACFTTAARIGYTYAGSADDRKQIKAVDCGYAAEAKGAVVLAEAEAKGEEIKTRVG
jgi:hypothetical protein